MYQYVITAMTRHGIAKYENKSPLARATFEQPVEVLLNAASQHKEDPLTGVSEQILMGITPNIGTANISVHRTEEYKKIVKEAAEEESDDEDEGWLTFDNSTTTNPFQTVAPPMLQPPAQNLSWNQTRAPAMDVVPMWAQSQHSMPVMQAVPAWNQDVIAAVNGYQTQPTTNMFAPPQNMFAPPQNMFAPPQNMFKPPPLQWTPSDGDSDGERPVSPAYHPDHPDSPLAPPLSSGGFFRSQPEYNPNGYNEEEWKIPTTPPYSPTSPEYTPPPSPTSPEYDEENVQMYDPMAGYGAEN